MGPLGVGGAVGVLAERVVEEAIASILSPSALTEALEERGSSLGGNLLLLQVI
jgi:hypothetical protein